MHDASKGSFDKLKLVVINVANGAGETSITVDYATYGIAVPIIYSHTIRDAHTAGNRHDNATGTSIVHTWNAADAANVLVWCMGL